MSGYEPRFDIDYDYGRQRQSFVQDLLDAMCAGQFRYEVKSPRYIDGDFYFETQQNPHHRGWKPSGVTTTESEYLVYVKGETAIFLPTSLVREAISLGDGRAVECSRGDNPTRGRLISFNWLMFRHGKGRE